MLGEKRSCGRLPHNDYYAENIKMKCRQSAFYICCPEFKAKGHGISVQQTSSLFGDVSAAYDACCLLIQVIGIK